MPCEIRQACGAADARSLAIVHASGSSKAVVVGDAFAVGTLAVGTGTTALAALVAIIWAATDVVRRILRWTGSQTTPPRTGTDDPSPFGSLPTLGPTGPLGGLAPDADIGSAATDERELYGE